MFVYGPVDLASDIDLTGLSDNDAGTGATATTSATSGGVGYFGGQSSTPWFEAEALWYSGIRQNDRYVVTFADKWNVRIIRGTKQAKQNSQMPPIALSHVDGVLDGLPNDLSGSSGAGAPASRLISRQPQTSPSEDRLIDPLVTETVIGGGNGGVGGGSFFLSSWGGIIRGRVITSGTAAPQPPSGSLLDQTFRGAPGGAGDPGGFIWGVDGPWPRPVINEDNFRAIMPATADYGVRASGRPDHDPATTYRADYTIQPEVNLWESRHRIVYIPRDESLETPQPETVFDALFQAQLDGEIEIIVADVRPTNANIGDMWITQSEVDSGGSTPVAEILTSTGWALFDWENDQFKTGYAALLSMYKSNNVTKWLYGSQFPTDFQEGWSFTHSTTGNTYLLRADGNHELLLTDETPIGEERNLDFNLAKTAQTYTDGFKYFVGLTDINQMPTQTGSSGSPITGGTTTLDPPINVAVIVYSETYAEMTFGTVAAHPEYNYGVYIDNTRVGEATGFFAFNNLSSGTQYQFGVRSEFNGETSSIVYLTRTTPGVATGSVPAPSGLVFAEYADTEGELTWTRASPESDGYRVYRDNIEIATTTNNTYYMNDLVAETSYSFAVAAYSGANESIRAVTTGSTSSGGGSTLTFAVISDGPEVQVSGTEKMEGRGLYMEFRDSGDTVIHTHTKNFSSNLLAYAPPNPETIATWTGFVVDSDGVGHPLPGQPITFSQV